jgi:hypothetical protein
MNTPQPPVLNLNGTSSESLTKEYRAASHALRQAIEAVQNITVNGRDFQTVDDALYQKARSEQTERLQKLQTVLEEIESLHEQVYEQQLARKR